MSACSSEYKWLIVVLNMWCQWTKTRCCCEQVQHDIPHDEIQQPELQTLVNSGCMTSVMAFNIKAVLAILCINEEKLLYIRFQQVPLLQCSGSVKLKNKSSVQLLKILDKWPAHPIFVRLLITISCLFIQRIAFIVSFGDHYFDKHCFMVLPELSDGHYMCKLSVELLSAW